MRAARALRIPYKIRSVVATTIAPALTATIVILVGMYLFFVNILSRLRIGLDALWGVPCLESLWPDNVGDTECRGNEGASCHLSWYQYWSFHRFMMDGDTFIVYPLKFAPVQAKINANGATVCHHEHHSYLIARTIVPTETRTIFTK